MQNPNISSTIDIDRDAVYTGARRISRIMHINKDNLKDYILNEGLPVRKDKKGMLIITGEDLYQWYGNLPLAKGQ